MKSFLIILLLSSTLRCLAQTSKDSILDLTTITITGNTANSSSHLLSRIDLNLAPARSAQDLLRLVPGLFIAQHQGGGKAEQIFLRGFDADHGTDVAISVDGIPVNLPSHAHGQGYADLHFLIPETVRDYDFGKGPYTAGQGDFATAGYVAYHTMDDPGHSFLKTEAGAYHTGRIVGLLDLLGQKQRSSGRNGYIAAEGLYADGPFTYPEHFNRINLFGKFITPLTANTQLTAMLSTFSSGWRAAGEIPKRAAAEGYINDRFGAIDSAQGGYTSRTNASLRLVSHLANDLTLDNQIWYSHYFFNLISNFTFYYFYPQTGDEFRQRESRDLGGTTIRLSRQYQLGNTTLSSVIGATTRYDAVHSGFIAHTAGGKTILDTIQLGRIREAAVGLYTDQRLSTGKWSFNASLRMDYLHFYYGNAARDSAAAVYAGLSPRAAKAILSPKINIEYTVDSRLQYFLRLGKGFHSNDTRIVIANKGYETLPGAYAADLGFNWKPAPGLFINAALWALHLQQEFTYGADLGDQAVSPGGRTFRKGIDLAVRYQPLRWLHAFLNIDWARPRALDEAKGENYLPLAPTLSSTGGLALRLPSGWNGGISYRYLHDRPANENNTVSTRGYFIADCALDYTHKKYELGFSIENLFNASWNEGQFDYTSRLKYESAPVEDLSYTPGTPFFLKLKYARFF